MDHKAEAVKLLHMAAQAGREKPDWAREYQSAAQVHALLDIADAIREQTASASWGGIRDDLGEVAHAIKAAH